MGHGQKREGRQARDEQILNYQFSALKDARPLDPGGLLLVDLNGPANGLRSGLSDDNQFVLAAVKQTNDVDRVEF